MIKRILIPVAFIFIFAIAFASAEVQTSGPYKWNKAVTLTQICGNCTYVNITAISLPTNGTSLLAAPVQMTKVDTVYNYTLGRTGNLGRHIVECKHDLNGIIDICNWDFYITTTGLDIPISLLFLIVGIVYVVVFLGVYKKDITITALGTFMMTLVGLFTLIYGLNIYKNWLTEGFSFITLGIAAYLSTIMVYEYIQ